MTKGEFLRAEETLVKHYKARLADPATLPITAMNIDKV